MLLSFSLRVATVFSAWARPNHSPPQQPGVLVCQRIAESISSASEVFYPGSGPYLNDISHWSISSTQQSQCSVEPGTAEDVATILRIVGDTRTPFAVKSGGHTSSPGFSSTTGVHIAMTRFDQVKVDSSQQTATIGVGLSWQAVYAALEPFSVNVAGGRVSGPGVGGFAVGGGYSWLTNQYGLTVDTIVAYELVLPSGVVKTVTEASLPDLFRALKGGGNNFGIVTTATLKTFPQSQVWAGLILYTADHYIDVIQANVKFCQSVTDPKAATITSFLGLFRFPVVAQQLFYDGPVPPPGIFDDFLKIPATSGSVSTRSFLSFVNETTDPSGGIRHLFHTVPIQNYTPNIFQAIVNESLFWSEVLLPDLVLLTTYSVEPFLPTILTHSTSPSAYPFTRSQVFSPLNIEFAWVNAESDELAREAARASANQIRQVALAEGQNISNAPLYPNYALSDTTLEEIYGENVDFLKMVKQAVDPNNVMGLAGGFKF